MAGLTRRVVSDATWTWFNDQRAVVRNGALYVAFVRSNGDLCVSKITLSTGARDVFTLSAAFEVDDHDNPALCFRADGRLVAAYSKHSDTTGVRVRIATNIEDISAWGAATTVTGSAGASGSTYANLHRLPGESDRIYLFWRGGNWYPTLAYSDDHGATWSTPVDLFEGAAGGGERPYVKYVDDGAGKLHFFASGRHPNTAAGTSHLYHWYYDASTGNFHTSNGSVIRALSTLTTTGKLLASEVTQVWDASSTAGNGNAWPWSIELDTDGRPVIGASEFESIDNNSYLYGRWTGSAWEMHTILTGQGSLYGTGDTDEDQYVGGIAIDPHDTTRVFLSNDTSGQWEMERWVTRDGGTTWATQAITSGSSVKNARPFCPRNRSAGCPEVLYWAGTYTSFTSFATDVKCFPSMLSPTHRELMLAANPVAYYGLDEPSGTNAEDLENANDGTHINGPTLGAAALVAQGAAATYNGTNQRTDLPDLSLGEGTFSYVTFFKTTQTGTDKMWIAESSTTDTDPFTTLGLHNGKVRGWLRNNSGTGAIEVVSPASYNDGNRHHAAFTAVTSGAGTSAVLIVNGVQRHTSSTASTVARTLNASCLGALRRATVGNWGAATLDEPALFNRVLTIPETNAFFEARDVPPQNVITLTPVATTDVAQTLAFTQGGSQQIISLTPVTTSDVAQALSLTKRVSIVAETTTDTAQDVFAGHHVTLTPGATTDAAQALSLTKRVIVVTVATIDTAMLLFPYLGVSITPTGTTDVAQSLTLHKRITFLDPATTQDMAAPLVMDWAFTLSTAFTTDTAQPLDFTTRLSLVPTTTQDAAQSVVPLARVLALAPVTTQDVAQALVIGKALRLTPCVTTSTARTLALDVRFTIAATSTLDSAQALVAGPPPPRVRPTVGERPGGLTVAERNASTMSLGSRRRTTLEVT